MPTALNQDDTGPCIGFNCTGSEMGPMFYNNMGASAYSSILSGTNTDNLALFQNLQSHVYWSGTVYAPNPATHAWYFGTIIGDQYYNPHDEFYAWAVRPGDVAAIPEPETYAMMVLGLAVLLGFGRLRQQS